MCTLSECNTVLKCKPEHFVDLLNKQQIEICVIVAQ